MPQWIFLVGMVVLLPFFFMTALSLDRLAKRFYDSHREEWRQAGNPRGFFWRAPEDRPVVSHLAFMKACLTWPFSLPPCLRPDPEAQRDLRLLRLGLIVWNVGVLTLFVVTMVLHRRP